MKLQNFGSILNFAIELETAGQAFYQAAAANPDCSGHEALFEEFTADGKKNEKNILRTRRENVTEMILEPIPDFTSDSFLSDHQGVQTMSLDEVVARALELEYNAECFYNHAAEKIRALPEVSRILARTATRRAAHKARLIEIRQHEKTKYVQSPK